MTRRKIPRLQAWCGLLLLILLPGSGSTWAQDESALDRCLDSGREIASRAEACREAAEQGHAKAQFYLGLMYAIGRGVTRDDAEAEAWRRRAAEQGFAPTKYSLASRYAIGEGVSQDDAEAATRNRRAAEQGQAGAQFNLGTMYAKGEGVPQDDVQAHLWFNLAGAGGNDEAREARDMVRKLMSREQVAEAQRLAREWKPKP